MASLRDMVYKYQDQLRDGIAWVAFWRSGRSWHGQAVYLDDGDKLALCDELLLTEDAGQDAGGVILNGYYSGYLGDDMSVEELIAWVRQHLQMGVSGIQEFVEEHRAYRAPETGAPGPQQTGAAGPPPDTRRWGDSGPTPPGQPQPRDAGPPPRRWGDRDIGDW